MTTVTITGKGQVTPRKDLLRHMGVEAGDTVLVNKLPDGRIEVKAVRLLEASGEPARPLS